jgi:hypothetical protein
MHNAMTSEPEFFGSGVIFAPNGLQYPTDYGMMNVIVKNIFKKWQQERST